ncbi:MAG: hypothetical protein ACREX3_15665 [Gammaproteobacteria bacterium]
MLQLSFTDCTIIITGCLLAEIGFASASELYLEHPPMKFDMPQIIAFIVLWMVVAFIIFTFF